MEKYLLTERLKIYPIFIDIMKEVVENEKNETKVSNSAKLLMPVAGRNVKGFGNTINPMTGIASKEQHTGIDYTASLGTPIYMHIAIKYL